MPRDGPIDSAGRLRLTDRDTAFAAPVDYEEAAAACDRLLTEAGSTDLVTAQALQRALGRGSLPALAGHLRAWKQQGAVRAVQRPDLLPDEIRRVVGAVEDVLGTVIGRERVQAQQHWGDRVASLGRELTDAYGQLDTALRESARLAGELAAERGRTARLTARTEELTRAAAESSGTAAVLDVQLAEARTARESLDAELAAARHAAARAEADARAARETLESERAAAARLRGERDALMHERDAARAETARAAADLQSARAETALFSAELLEARRRADEQAARDRAEIITLSRALERQRPEPPRDEDGGRSGVAGTPAS